MFNTRWLVLAAFMSCSSFAGVSFQQKQLRVNSLMKLQKFVPAISFEGYQRELEYEKRALPLELRAKTEANLLADKIRRQVQIAYKEALQEHKSPELAREEVSNAIERDLELADPGLKEELMELAAETLKNIDQGAVSQEVDLAGVEEVMLVEVAQRSKFLNAESLFSETILPTANDSRDSERKDYRSKAELMESLVSERESSRWVSTANQTVKTAEIVKAESKISLKLKMEFLRATLEAGPTIAFKREYSTDAVVLTEGLNPVMLSNGEFDLWKRDSRNKIIVKNGKQQRRYVAFYCEADLKFATDYSGSGGFKYMGLGTDTTVSKTFQNTVNLQSRRIALPESVGNKTVDVKFLSKLCHNDFLKARPGNMTIANTLDVMMRNMVSGLIFTHSKTKCASTSNCQNWFRNEVISLEKKKNVARCVEHKRDKYRFCQLRGDVGQNCPVYENGKRTSSGVNEYPCDFGLRCVKYESATYFFDYSWSYSRGRCQK